MKIGHRYIFIIISLFLILFNFTVLRNIQTYYIRQIISASFILIVPGTLLLHIIKPEKTDFWENVCYSTGLSVSYIMFGGLLINWILPLFGYTKPLSLHPIIWGIDISIIILLLIAFFRNKNSIFNINLPKLSISFFTFILILLTIPVIGIFGTISLNNGSSNIYLAMSLIILFLYILTTGWKKNCDNLYPISLFIIAFTVLIQISLRSWHISGWDINQEYKVFQLTQNLGRWSISNINHTYNSCISITIFPTVISLLSSINPEYIFKIIYQFLFAITPVIAYLIANKFYSKRTSYFAAIYLISHPIFIQPMTALMRQEIAFIFISLLFLTLMNKSLSGFHRSILFIICSLSLIISHYSTTYIALFLLSLIYLIRFPLEKSGIIKNFRNRMVIKSKTVLSFKLLILFLLCTFFWNVQLTRSSDNIVFVIGETFQNMKNIFKEELRSNEVFGYLSVNNKIPSLGQEKVNTYLNKLALNHNTEDTNYYNSVRYKDYQGILINDSFIAPKIPYQTSIKINTIINIIKSLTKILIVPGFIYFIYLFIKKSVISLEYFLLITISIGMIVMIIVIPNISLRYNIDRLYLQVMFFVSPILVSGLSRLLVFLNKNYKFFIISAIISLYFLTNTNIQSYFTGGFIPLTLNNSGDDYNKFYTHESEISATKWLSIYRHPGYYIEADPLASLRFQAFSDIQQTKQSILPEVINPKSYVYTSYTNNKKGLTWIMIEGNSLSIESPNNFLASEKAIIYNNNSVKIYK